MVKEEKKLAGRKLEGVIAVVPSDGGTTYTGQ